MTVGSKQIYCDARLGGVKRYILTDNPSELMQVPEETRLCVAFIGYRNADGMYILGGTVFFVTRPVEGLGASFLYGVTAKHVIDKIRDKGTGKVCLRLNFKDGEARWVETDLVDWFFHPDSDVDVALLRGGFPPECDHLYLSINMLVSDELIARHEIGYGDDVLITGLFARHHGLKRNIPIVRVGNIAAMPEERVETGYGFTEAYLIEARSISGVSGSPVFVNLGTHRFIGGQFMQTESGRPILYLLGLVHGHWDAMSSDYDTLTEDAASAEKVNVGIAIVIPASKIMEVINQPMVKKLDDEEEKELRKQRLPVADSVDEELTSETFEDALKRASRRVSQPESESDET